MLDDSLKSYGKIRDRLSLISPGLEHFSFDKEFWKFKNTDAYYGFDGKVYAGGDRNMAFSDFREVGVSNFFGSGDMWLSGSDLNSYIEEKNILDFYGAPLTENQGYDFGNKLIDAYVSKKEEYSGMASDSVVVFDFLFNMIWGADAYLKGIEAAEKERGKVIPNLYMFAGDRSKNLI